MLDASSVFGFNIITIELHVTAIQHGILRRRDVDKRRLHTWENVLYLTDVNVAVNLANIVCWTTDVMLNQASAFHDRCLSNPVTHLNTHEVTPNRPTIALTTTATFDDFSV